MNYDKDSIEEWRLDVLRPLLSNESFRAKTEDEKEKILKGTSIVALGVYKWAVSIVKNHDLRKTVERL